MSLSTSVCKLPLLAVKPSWLLPLSFSVPCYYISTQGHKGFYSRVYVWMCIDVLLSHTCRGQKCWRTHWPHFSHTQSTHTDTHKEPDADLQYQALILLLQYLHVYPSSHNAVSIIISTRIFPTGNNEVSLVIIIFVGSPNIYVIVCYKPERESNICTYTMIQFEIQMLGYNKSNSISDPCLYTWVSVNCVRMNVSS